MDVKIFVDNSWFYKINEHLNRNYRSKIRHEKLPEFIQAIFNKLGISISNIETRVFCSLPDKCHKSFKQQNDYFNRLGKIKGFSIERFQLQKCPRTGRYKEKGVDVAISVYMARDEYDIGILVTGDSDYLPVIQTLKDEKILIIIGYEDMKYRYYPTHKEMRDNTDSNKVIMMNDYIKYLAVESRKVKH